MSARPGLGTVVVRPAVPGDAAALRAMFGRCSYDSRYRRFHGPVAEVPASYLRQCLEEGRHTLVAEVVADPDGGTAGGREGGAEGGVESDAADGMAGGAEPRIVGFAGTGPVAGAPHLRELGVLVEDAWQRKGIGRLLVDEVLAGAHRAGTALIRLEMCRSHPSLIASVVAHLEVVATESSGCDITIDVAVPAPAHPAYESRKGESSVTTVSS